MLLDTHFHLDFLAPELRSPFLEALKSQGIGLVAQTLLPSAYAGLRASGLGQEAQGPRLSLGLHPWWLTSTEQAQEELAIFEQELASTRFIGEIGLDFYPRRLETAGKELQVSSLRRILLAVRQAAASASAQEPYVLSLHTVRSAGRLLDLLEEIDIPGSPIVPVLHRFGGSSDELTRLMRLGGYISVFPQMLAGKRGRAYIRQVPASRLLLETDLPEAPTSQLDTGAFAAHLAQVLRESVARVSEERQEDFLPHLYENQARLYGP